MSLILLQLSTAFHLCQVQIIVVDADIIKQNAAIKKESHMQLKISVIELILLIQDILMKTLLLLKDIILNPTYYFLLYKKQKKKITSFADKPVFVHFFSLVLPCVS